MCIETRFRRTILALTLVSPATFATQLPASAAADRPIGVIDQVFAFHDAMPTGVTVSDGRTHLRQFPTLGDAVPFTVGEIRDGKVQPYPNAAINTEDPYDPAKRFISVQSVVADGKGRVWVQDTAAPEFSTPRPGGAKLVAIDLASNQVVKILVFPPEVILPSTCVNDMRFDFRVGKQGTVYVTDSSVSGPGGIIVMDIATGKASRRLSGAAQTSVDPAFVPVVEGKPALLSKGADGKPKAYRVGSDP